MRVRGDAQGDGGFSVIARRELPPDFIAWNRQWGAPYGNWIARHFLIGERERWRWRLPRLAGTFAFMVGCPTRAFEYPWAFHAAPLRRGLVAADLGGSLAGFQFVLARHGLEVHNVDPGEAATGLGWPVTAAKIDALNRAFGTDVTLHPCRLEEAGLRDESVDLVYAISVIEHIPPEEIGGLMREIRRILRPGGAAVLTVDLFFDLAPFTDRRRNQWGTNIDMRELVEASGLALAAGDRRELLGFDDFDPERVLREKQDFLLNHNVVCSQGVVLAKRGA
jgi:SAM-dependent methyltransferase